jgi:membrane protein implicated in regulation of membrane protease activity
MHAVFVACLFGGFVATVLLAALGALGAGHAGHAHAHAGHLTTSGTPHGHALGAHAPHGHTLGAHGPHGQAVKGSGLHGATQMSTVSHQLAVALGWTLSWLSPLTLAAGALWFGGAGLLAEGLLPPAASAVAVPLAVVAAVLGAAFVRAAMAAFVRASTPPLHGDAVGAVGTLSAPIRADAPGEVIYALEGLRCSAAARSVDGAPLPRGTSVVIVRRERGIAWVEPLDPLAALNQQSAPTRASDRTQQGDLSPPSTS